MLAILVYLLIILATVTQSASCKSFGRRGGDGTVFNAIKASVAALFSLIVALCFGGLSFHLPTLLFGVSYGLLLSVSMYAGYRALCLGPMALTSMLVSFSVVLPLIWGVAVRGEELNVYKYVAFALLAVAIVSANADKMHRQQEQQEEKKNGSHALWILFVALTFLANGICSVLQKEHQLLFPEMYSREFTFFAMLVCAVVFTVTALIKVPPRQWRGIPGLHLGILAGVTNALVSLLTLVLAGFENASVLFPIISVGTILGSLLFGRVVFGEKLKKNHYLALAVGLVAAVLLKL